jgi:hypothetical protein
MKKILFLLFMSQITLAQVKSQSGPISFDGKSANAFTIELFQSIEYVTQLFNSKFEIERLGKPKLIQGVFNSYFQIKSPKISTSYLDLYYNIEEIKSDNGGSVKVTLLMSKGYDNFISKDTDLPAAIAIQESLNDLGISVERKNFEILIAKKEQEIQFEKQKLLLVEDELRAHENEKKELEIKISKINTVLISQAKITQDLGNELQKLKYILSDFERTTTHKSKSILKTVSKQ